jgi:hypothetical protein
MSVRVSQEFFTEFQRWSDQFFKQWRDDLAAHHREKLISLSSPSENPKEKQPTKETIAPPLCKDKNPNEHSHSIPCRHLLKPRHQHRHNTPSHSCSSVQQPPPCTDHPSHRSKHHRIEHKRVATSVTSNVSPHQLPPSWYPCLSLSQGFVFCGSTEERKRSFPSLIGSASENIYIYCLFINY